VKDKNSVFSMDGRLCSCDFDNNTIYFNPKNYTVYQSCKMATTLKS